MKEDQIFSVLMAGSDEDVRASIQSLGLDVDENTFSEFLMTRQRSRRIHMYFFVSMVIWLAFGLVTVVFRDSIDKTVQLVLGLVVGSAVLCSIFWSRKIEKEVRKIIDTIVTENKNKEVQ